MNKTMFSSIAALLIWSCASNATAQDDSRTIQSYYSKTDFSLSANPNSKDWKLILGVIAERGPRGELTPGHQTEIRSRWTDNHLYLLFICKFDQLYSKPNRSTATETNQLWDWDVAETFIGPDFQNIKRYREFQISPHGEWVDLDIDRNPTPPNHDVQWNSGYEVKARIDERGKVWYGEMRIPMDKIDSQKPQAGQGFRINFFRFQGPPPDRKRIAWQPTNADTFHVPESFGHLQLQATSNPGFSELQRILKKDDKLTVTLDDGSKTKGRLMELSSDRIVLRLKANDTRSFEASQIDRIQRRHNGVVLGAIIGAGVMLPPVVVAYMFFNNESARDEIAVLAGLAIGAGIGAGIDALIPSNRTVYTRQSGTRIR